MFYYERSTILSSDPAGEEAGVTVLFRAEGLKTGKTVLRVTTFRALFKRMTAFLLGNVIKL